MTIHRFKQILLVSAALISLAVGAHANPVGPTVVGGAATVQGQGTPSVVIKQQSDKAIINWQKFNIAPGETTRFMQPSNNSVALNRVTGGLGPSQIFGTLTANGRIFVVNPDGILFGAGSVVDTAGFLATTHDIKNSDFMAGKYQFGIPGNPNASIVNLGTITARDNGFAALVAPGVRNSGLITANLGSVGLASGNGFTLDFYGDKLITLQVGDQIASRVRDVATGQPLDTLVKNDGKLKANGGRVELSAVATQQVVDSVINNTGVIEANSVGERNGTIILGAATAANKPLGAPTQKVKVSGTLSASGKKAGEKGGKVQIIGEAIEVSNARIDAWGDSGGGKVLIGGDWSGGHPQPGLVSNPSAVLETDAIPTATNVTIDAATTIDASATRRGNGGKAIAWADQSTLFEGSIWAKGGAESGNGGFVETSGHQTLSFDGVVDTRALNGENGLLLLDPHNLTIQASGPGTVSSGPGSFTANVDNSILTVAALQNALALGNVTVETGSGGSQPGDIFVASNITWGGTSFLSLSAGRNITINPGVVFTYTGPGAAPLLDSFGFPVIGIGAGLALLTNGAVFYPGTGPYVVYSNASGKLTFFRDGSFTASLADGTFISQPADPTPPSGTFTGEVFSFFPLPTSAPVVPTPNQQIASLANNNTSTTKSDSPLTIISDAALLLVPTSFPESKSVQISSTTPFITSLQQSELQNLINSPKAWTDAGNIYGLVSLILKINSYSDLDKLIPTLQKLGIYDAQTISVLRDQLVGKAIDGFLSKEIYDGFVINALASLEKRGLVSDSNLVLNATVLKSLADTAFNISTANLPGEISGQVFQVATQIASLNKESTVLVNELIKQGAGDIDAWSQANKLRAEGTASSIMQADKIVSAISSEMATTNIVMNNLANGSLWPAQTEAANKWSIIATVLNAKNIEMKGGNAAGYIEIAKELSVNLDKAQGTYNVPITESYLKSLNNQYQDFAATVAKAYNVSGW